VDGKQWERLRRTLAPLFGRTMTAGFASAMERVAADLVERWHNLGDGAVVEIKAEMSRVALEALVGCIFSEGLGNPKAVCDATTRYYATCGGLDPFDILGLPDFVPRFTRLGVQQVLRDFYEALSTAIAERRRSLAAKPNAPRDMLGAMLVAKDPQTGEQMTEAEVRDNVVTFIFGGQETTSSALTWAIYLLSESPEWRERVANEADEVIGGTVQNALGALIQTRAVVEEALRLYPPIIGITRTALRRTELAGRTIDRGTMVVISPYVVHRHRLLWRDPDVFDPTRFLPERSKTTERYSFLPFGVGPRMCIGAALAVQEATMVLSALTRRFVLELVAGQAVWPVVDFTMKPRGGLRMLVNRRLPPEQSCAAE
jgi:cytochrome P450